MKLLVQIIFLAVLSLGLSPVSFAAQEIGSISEVTGGVDILKGGKLPAVAAKVGDKISQGDVIRTKSVGKAQIQFKDDSIITIAPDSRVALNEYVYEPEQNKREASIKIFNGLVHTVVNKIFNKEKPDFTVETQTAVIGVRGTDYYTLVGPAVSDIYNNSGITEVRNVFAEVPGLVKLRGREYTQVSKSLPPTLPLPLTSEDINWIKGQMTPKMAAKPSGSGAVFSQTQLLANVSEGSVQTQNVTPTAQTSVVQTNVIQNVQSAVYVPPQPVSTSVATILPLPLNLYVTWGSGAVDLDLYLNSPNGTFYYGNTGTPTSSIYYHLDSVVPNGAEVITISNWTPGATYVAYVQDYTNRLNSSSTILSSSSGVSMQFLQGGTVSTVAIPGGNKAIVTGGTPVTSTLSPTSGLVGNNWTAANIIPSSGRITPVNTIGPYTQPTANPVAAAPAMTAPRAAAR
jgi:hypothetical protein